MNKLIASFTLCWLSLSMGYGQQTEPTEADVKWQKLEQQYKALHSAKDSIHGRLLRLEQKAQTQEQREAMHSIRLDSLSSIQRHLVDTVADARTKLYKHIDNTKEEIGENLNQTNSRGLWAIGSTLALGLLLFLLSWRAYRGVKNRSIEQVSKLQNSLLELQVKIQEESISLDNKLLQLMEKQLSMLESQHAHKSELATDHSLAVKIADELVRIKVNLSRMDEHTKGYKQLQKAVSRIQDNFRINGYEIVEMLGQPYNEGMKVTASFVQDDSLAKGESIITSITKPQINYNGVMIQAAQVTVSQNI